MKLPSTVLFLVAAVFFFLAHPANAISGASEIGGTYRYGHIYWTAIGNEVDFRLEVVFKRNVTGLSYWKGSAVDGLGQVGDEIVLVGRESPQFYYGDGMIEMVPKMRVAAYSVTEDWIMGEYRKTYTYASPSNGEVPWMARFTGCCRSSKLVNNKDVSWSISAAIDLSLASQSPRAHSLPVITVPSSNPSFFVPADDNTASAVSWKIATPFEVGTAVELNGSSYLAVNLSAHHQAFVDDKCEPGGPQSGPACLFQALRTYAEPAALTVEGWVRLAQPEGGYVVTVSKGPKLASSSYPATLLIRVNATHVTAGHENVDAQGTQKTETDFEVCSSPALQSSDECRLGLHMRWVHVAVIRYQMAETPFNTPSRVKVSYRVMVNGEVLETLRFAVRSREEAFALNGGQDYAAGESPLALAPPFTPGSSSDSDAFAGDLSLLFGAYRGNAAPPAMLQARIDEWRFWSGALTPSAVKSGMHSPLKPEKRQYYGDPSAERDLSRETRGYEVGAVLLASWGFDAACPADTPDCPLPALPADYPAPDDPRVPDKAPYRALPVGAVRAGPTDNTGVMFYSEAGGVAVNPLTGEVTLATTSTGLHQVLLLLTFAGGALHVPVDMMVDVSPAQCAADTCGFVCPGTTHPRSFPALSVFAPAVADPAAPGEDSRALYVADAVEEAARLDDASFQSVLFPGSLRTFAGFHFGATFSASKPPAGALEALQTQIGFTVGALRSAERMHFSTPQGTDPAHMHLRWLPCAGDAGNHTVCVDAVDSLAAGVATCLRRAASVQRCLRVRVHPDPAPRFLTGEGQTPTEPIEVVMGQTVALPVVAVDDNCMDTVALSLHPDTAAAGAALGEGELVAVEEGGVALPCRALRRVLTWTPSTSQGGMAGELCVAATDTGGNGRCKGQLPHTTLHCVGVRVRRCEYALQYDQELQQLAGMFGTDWMRLWSLNPALMHPDFLVLGAADATVHVGHLMVAAEGEEPAKVAARMGMPLAQLQLLNHDLDVAEPIPPGATICVIPNSCEGKAGSAFRQDYADPSFARDAPQ